MDGTNAEGQLKLNDGSYESIIEENKAYDKDDEAIIIKREIEYENSLEISDLKENIKNEEIEMETQNHISSLEAMELDMRKKFNDAISCIISTKRDDNKAFLNAEEYSARIASVKQSKIVLQTPRVKKTTTHYRTVRKYDVLTINGIERLIKPMDANSKQILYYITNEELFDVLHTTHFGICHGGRNRMIAELKNNYCNITKESIMVYLRLCPECPKKACPPKRDLTSKPNMHSALESRAWVDFIDMQPQSYNNFRFIMVYQDYLTKFILLRALKSTHAKEIASHLLEIYTNFGAPVVLDSDNGREFVNSILAELRAMWSDVKIATGKPRQNQGQNSSERTNRDIKEMVSVWMAKNKSTDWPLGIKFIQFQKNRTRHSGINKSPYEAMFGCPARVGLASLNVPLDENPDITKEEDVDVLIKQSEKQHSIRLADSESEEDVGNNSMQIMEIISTDSQMQIESGEPSQTGFEHRAKCMTCLTILPPGEDVNHDGLCLNCERKENITNNRKRSRECLENQTNKMRKSANDRLSAALERTTRYIPVADVDQSRGSARSGTRLFKMFRKCVLFYKICLETIWMRVKVRKDIYAMKYLIAVCYAVYYFNKKYLLWYGSVSL